jgi:hypothetical protein
MAGVSSRCLCRSLFRKLDILTLPCLYIFSLMLFVLKNTDSYQTNSFTHRINTRYKNQLHRPVANLSCFQKQDFYSGLKIFNSLPLAILKCQNNKLHFRAALRKYLVSHSFYSLDGYFTCSQNNSYLWCSSFMTFFMHSIFYSGFTVYYFNLKLLFVMTKQYCVSDIRSCSYRSVVF